MLLLQIDLLKETFQEVFNDIIKSSPKVIGFIGYIFFVWIFIKVFLIIVRKVLNKTNIDQLSKKIIDTNIFGNSSVKVKITDIIIAVFKWFLILVFVMAGANMFGITVVSNGLLSFFAYLPKLILALSIFIAGVYFGSKVRNAIKNMFKSLEINGGNLVGSIGFYLIVVFLTITALDVAGVDTSIIKSNLTLIIGSILAAFTLAFGLGARDAVSRLLFGYYSRRNITIGSEVKIGETSGIVVAIDNICLSLKTKDGLIIIPIKEVVDNIIIIKNN